ISQTYSISLRATDLAGNATTASCGTVTVAAGDFTPPVIGTCSISPTSLPASGGVVTIRATVTDNVSVQAVTATILKPDGSSVDLALARGTGDNWSGTFTAEANTGTAAAVYRVRLRAVDPSSNSAGMDCSPFTVAAAAPDRTRPVIRSCKLSPKSLSSGGVVTIQATVTDNVAVGTVVATITRLSTTATVTLTHTTGTAYTGTFSPPANPTRSNQTYRVRLQATDTAGNRSAVRNCGTFTVRRS
ncbi:MAG TPA: Ig-like domain repeat protein, partial [Armatimonadota bacterium]|nr:Ig-like domain repeat protein [Armatimonadota bacterium]